MANAAGRMPTYTTKTNRVWKEMYQRWLTVKEKASSLMYPTYEEPSPRSARTAWPRHPNPLNTPPALSISSTGQPSRPWIVRWVRQPPGVVDFRSLQELALAAGVPRMDHTALTHWMLGNTMHVGTFMVVQAAVLSSCVIRSDTCENVADAVPGKKRQKRNPMP